MSKRGSGKARTKSQVRARDEAWKQLRVKERGKLGEDTPLSEREGQGQDAVESWREERGQDSRKLERRARQGHSRRLDKEAVLFNCTASQQLLPCSLLGNRCRRCITSKRSVPHSTQTSPLHLLYPCRAAATLQL